MSFYSTQMLIQQAALIVEGLLGLTGVLLFMCMEINHMVHLLLMVDSTEVPLPNTPILETVSLFADELLGSDVALPISNSFYLEIPKDLLNLTAIDIPIGVVAGDSFGIYDVLDLDYDLQKWLKDPTLITYGNGIPKPGTPYSFSVSGLTPNDIFNLYLGEEIMFSDILSDTGSFSGSFIFPDTLTPTEVYTLTVQDSTGEFAYSHTCPVPEPSTLLLLGSGLAGLVGLGRKRLFKKTRH